MGQGAATRSTAKPLRLTSSLAVLQLELLCVGDLQLITLTIFAKFLVHD